MSAAPGSFAEFRRGADLLLERRVPFVVKGALLPPKREEMEELAAWAADSPMDGGRPVLRDPADLRGRRDIAARNRAIARLRSGA